MAIGLLGWACGLLASPTRAEGPSGEPPPEALIDAIPFHPSTPQGYVVIDLDPDGRPEFLLMLGTGAGG